MTRQELIHAVEQAMRSAHPEWDVSAVLVKTILETMGDVAAAELLGGGEVPLPKLGKLKVREMAAREGHNPITGEVITIPAHKKAAFFAGKDLKEAMN